MSIPRLTAWAGAMPTIRRWMAALAAWMWLTMASSMCKHPFSQAYIWGLGSPSAETREKKEGDVIVMHLPQLYCFDAGAPYYAQRLVPSADGKTFVVDSTSQDVKFTWKGNKLTQVDDCLVGLCDATGEWFYMGDFNIKYTINPDKPIVKPEGLAKATCKMEIQIRRERLDSQKSL